MFQIALHYLHTLSESDIGEPDSIAIASTGCAIRAAYIVRGHELYDVTATVYCYELRITNATLCILRGTGPYPSLISKSTCIYW
jgi:glutamine synthetase type III